MFLRFNASKDWSNIAGTDEEGKRPALWYPPLREAREERNPIVGKKHMAIDGI